ncbi:hypothetical protein IKR20_04050 [bacterium]|nr:hypothetical protein [bacterium]
MKKSLFLMTVLLISFVLLAAGNSRHAPAKTSETQKPAAVSDSSEKPKASASVKQSEQKKDKKVLDAERSARIAAVSRALPSFGRIDPGNEICRQNYSGCGDLRWEILDVQGNRALVFSKVNYRYSSDLAKWLNEEFYHAAFSPSDKQRILAVNPAGRIFQIKEIENMLNSREGAAQNTGDTVRPALWIELDKSLAEDAEIEAHNAGLTLAKKMVVRENAKKIASKFGTYAGTGIVWYVLDIQDGKALMITKEGLDARRFNPENTGNSWVESEIRGWLNGTFFNSAFSDEERSRISANVEGDKVFLLNSAEVVRYFPRVETRICRASEEAKKNGAWTDDSGAGFWWLRSPGNNQNLVENVSSGGEVNSGRNAGFIDALIRPSVWVSLD